jgi:hypothetical protein
MGSDPANGPWTLYSERSRRPVGRLWVALAPGTWSFRVAQCPAPSHRQPGTGKAPTTRVFTFRYDGELAGFIAPEGCNLTRLAGFELLDSS